MTVTGMKFENPNFVFIPTEIRRFAKDTVKDEQIGWKRQVPECYTLTFIVDGDDFVNLDEIRKLVSATVEVDGRRYTCSDVLSIYGTQWNETRFQLTFFFGFAIIEGI